MSRFAVVHCLLILVAMSFFRLPLKPSRPSIAIASRIVRTILHVRRLHLLATIQISFFANVFGVDQSEIVKKKQTGILTDDLWIANWVAKKSGVSPDTRFV